MSDPRPTPSGPMRRRVLEGLLGVAAGGTAAAFGTDASAQAGADWPTRAVNVVLGFAAGGPTDAICRILAEQLSRRFGQSFVVENRAGAGGGIAATAVRKAAPDGHTLMFGSSGTLTILPHLQKNPGFDVTRDFTPIGLVASYPYFLVVAASAPWTTLDELLRQGRAPGANLTFGSAGNGAVNHLAGEWFAHETRMRCTHVPYKGDSAAIADIMTGRVDFGFMAGAAAFPQVKGGRLRLLASASATPGRGGPGIPTIGESVVRGFAAEPWNGLMGPAGLPRELVVRLNDAINEAMARKDVLDRLASMEQYPLTGSPGQFATHIAEQAARWAGVIKTADIKAD